MKADKKIVLSNIRGLDLSKLHFAEADCFERVHEDQSSVKHDVIELRRKNSTKDRVYKILDMSRDYPTFDNKNKFQCRSDANRSAVDIWRLYNNYFRPVTLFTIMRTLYDLVVEDEEIETIFCNDIKKQVFYACDNGALDDVFRENELGVRFAEWRTIGL